MSTLINKYGHLQIGGCDSIDLANRYGTPLYVIDETIFRNNCKCYKNAIDRYYDGRGMALYASKAFSTMAICKIVDQEGLGLDVVSGGELYTALKAGFPTDKIYFHGNNKTVDEIELAIINGVKSIVVDNIEELFNVNEIAQVKNKKVDISFRIKPGIDVHTHDFIKTGQIDSKFGFALENGEAMDFVKIAIQLENINLTGIHCHIGSQIFDLEPFELAAEILIQFMSDIKQKFGIELEELNLGGGFGIKYVPKDDPVEYEYYIKAISKIVKTLCNKKGLKLPYIIVEPGRSISGPSGITLYKVGNVKEIKGVRTYVSVDGGMTDNPRYALYQAEYDACIANRPNEERTQEITLAGKCCESGDIIIKQIKMPEIKRDDIIAVYATGAYNYSMSSNYNRIPKPAVVMVKDGESKIIVKREDYEDIIRNDIIPEGL